jgi:hypothetical protein
MDNNSTTEEHSNKRRESTEIKIEDKIYNMLDEVMEEKDDSNDSFQYDCGTIDDEYKFSRPSTRRCTNQNPNESNLNLSNNMTQFLSFPSFNRNFKRNMTHHLNQVSHPHFNQNKNQSIQMPRKSAQFSVFDFNSLNSFAPNYYNNSFNSNNLFQYNNNLNLNLSMQSLNSANPQFNESFINNNNLIGNNYYNENFNGQNNFFRPNLMTNLNNNDVNCINKPLINNINSNINMNNTNNDFKRKENRKKTHDVQNNFQKKKYVNDYLNNNNLNYNNNNSRYLFRKSMSINNNINNNNLYLKNIIMNNSINNNDIINNMNSENTNSFFNTNNTNINNNLNNNNNINDNLIFELKHLLEHTGKIDFYIYNLIKGKIVSIIKNHKGSKIFQKYLKSTHSDEILHLIFIELLPFLVDLIIDPYANYFCKKFFTFLNAKDRIDFLKNIEKALIELSSDSIGTYPIQSIIEHLNTNNEKNIFLAGIKEGYVKLIYDAFGCHVLEKLLTCFEDEYVDFIYTYIFDNFLYLTNNSNGIYIIKKILTFVQKKNLHEKLKSIVKKNAIFLIKQSYGNFVIQVIIENWEDYKEITDLFKGNFFALSLEKYASNVIERCIEKDKEILENYINEIIENKCISNVMKSNYGNYVVQKVIKLAEGENKKKFVFNAAKDIDKINDNKLIQKWKSLLSPHINELDKEQIDILKEQKYFS